MASAALSSCRGSPQFEHARSYDSGSTRGVDSESSSEDTRSLVSKSNCSDSRRSTRVGSRSGATSLKDTRVMGLSKHTSKVFVGGIPRNMDRESFYQLFTKFGRIKRAWIQSDKHDVRRGFGFVVFCDCKTVDVLLGKEYSRFVEVGEGSAVEVKRALDEGELMPITCGGIGFPESANFSLARTKLGRKSATSRPVFSTMPSRPTIQEHLCSGHESGNCTDATVTVDNELGDGSSRVWEGGARELVAVSVTLEGNDIMTTSSNGLAFPVHGHHHHTGHGTNNNIAMSRPILLTSPFTNPIKRNACLGLENGFYAGAKVIVWVEPHYSFLFQILGLLGLPQSCMHAIALTFSTSTFHSEEGRETLIHMLNQASLDRYED